MSDKFDTDYLEAGDSFEGGPIEQSYFISAIMAAGGEIEVHGNKVLVISLPKKESPKAKAPVSAKPVEKAPEPVAAVVEVKEEPKPDPGIAVAPAPKAAAKPGPKPKAAPAPAKEEG